MTVTFFYYNNYVPQSVAISTKDANEGSPVTNQQQSGGYPNYHGSTENTKTPLTPAGDCNTLMHAKMYALGEKYGIDSLKVTAKDKFAEAVTYAWNHANFVATIKLVFTTTPESDTGLRDLTIKAILEHQGVLSKKPAIENAIKNIEGLSYGLWKGLAKHAHQGPLCWACGKSSIANCSRCRATFIGCDCYNMCGLSKCKYCG